MGIRGRKSRAELTVVASGAAIPGTTRSSSSAPPADLGAPGKKLWQQITSEFRLDSSAEEVQLHKACVVHERSEEMRKIVADEGVMIYSEETGVGRPHPLLKELLQAEALGSHPWKPLSC